MPENKRRASTPEIMDADSDDAAMLFRDHAAGHSDLIPPPPGRLLTVLICGVFGPSVKPVGWI